jgi:drug/metabolite transporter (DMT)-like permease
VARPAFLSRFSRSDWQVWAALLIVYFVWGSTYLAIRVVVQSMPPLVAGGVRFLVAGLILGGVLLLRGAGPRFRGSRAELGGAALVGLLLLLLGNGGVSFGEQTVPSALAALIVGVIPLIVLIIRRIAGERISTMALGGVVLGFVGLAVLVVPQGIDATVSLVGVAILLVASVAWAAGTYLSGRVALPDDPFVSTTYQLLFGGAMLLVVGTLLGESSGIHLESFSQASFLALGYLIVFGSLLAYTTYTWLLQNAPVSKVATYAYVNPVVAVVLGFLILQEDISLPMLLGAVLIVASVAFTIRTTVGGSNPEESAPPTLDGDAHGAAHQRRTEGGVEPSGARPTGG